MRGCELLSVLVVCRLQVVNRVGLDGLGCFLLGGPWVWSSLTVLTQTSRAGGDAGLILTELQPRAVSCPGRAFGDAGVLLGGLHRAGWSRAMLTGGQSRSWRAGAGGKVE